MRSVPPKKVPQELPAPVINLSAGKNILPPCILFMVQEPEFTKASSKGQIVIPRKIRKKLGIKEGSVLSVATEKDIIVLKKMDAKLTAEDLKSLKLVKEAWKDIEKGRYKVSPKEAFFDELKRW